MMAKRIATALLLACLLPSVAIGDQVAGGARSGEAASKTAEGATTPADGAAPSAIDPAALYTEHCAQCHAPNRIGAMGPSLLPESLARLPRAEAMEVVRDGRKATQMTPFADRLDAKQIQALVDFLYTQPAQAAHWRESDIRATHRLLIDPATLKDAPVFAADLDNLFIVVESGDHHVSLLDGERFEVVHRFKSHFALHGGPKYSPDGRFVYFASRDGWISKFDIWNLKTVAEIRAGLNTRNLAVSSDGKWVMVGNYLPQSLVLLKADDLSLDRVIEVRGANGKASRVSAVYDAAPRSSFVVALKDVPELWEMSYDPKAEPVQRGLVHDYRMKEAISEPGMFTPRVTPLDEVLDDFFFDPEYRQLIGSARGGKAQVINLDVRRRVATLDLDGMPHLGSGISWERDGHRVMASPNLKDGRVTVIDMKDWSRVKDIPVNGPGFFIRSHEKSRHAWVDAMMSRSSRDTLQIIDKQSLEVVASVTPSPGRTAAHVEFTRDGRHALVSLMERDGALVVYDASSFKEVKRIPMSRPVGKYNVFNKTRRSEGTSH